MGSMWHYRLFGEDFGPVPEETLQELIQIGTLGESDEIRSAATSSWTTVSHAFGNRGRGETFSTTMTAVTDAESADEVIDWYCLVSGQELGPLAFNELLRFAENGELSADDEVRFGPTGRWRKVGTLGRLMASLPYQAIDPTPKPVNRSKTNPQTPTVSTAVRQPPPSPAPAPIPAAPSYLPAAHESSWFAWMGGTEYGPVSLLQLQEWQNSGQLNDTGMVKYGPMGTWTPPAIIAQTLAQFTMAAAPTPVPVAPPAAPVSKPVTPPQAPPAVAKTPAAPVPAKSAAVASKPTNSAPKPPETMPTVQPVATVLPVAEVKPSAPPREVPKPVTASTPPRPPAPAWQPPKATPKKPSSSGGGGIDFGFLAPLAETKNLAIVGGCLVAIALYFVFPMLSSGFGRDKVYLEQLQAILMEYRQLREKKAASNEWTSFGDKAKKTAAEIAKAVEPQASRAAPQKQYLLWNAKFRLNEMLQKAQEPYVAAEYEFENNIYEAAKIMNVPMDPPPPPPPPPGAKPLKVNPNLDKGS